MKNFRIYLFIALALLFLLEDSVLLYNRLHQDKTIVGLKLNGINVSALSKSQTATVVKNKLDTETPLNLSYDGKIFAVRKKDIEAQIDYQQTLDQLVAEGRTGNIVQNFIVQNGSLLGLDNKKIVSRVSKPLLLLKVLDIANQINKPPQPPTPDFSGNWANTIPQKNGVKTVTSKLSQIILTNIFAPPLKPISVPTQAVVKTYSATDLEKIRKQAAEYISQPISITSGGVIFTLSPQELKSLLTLSEQTDQTNPKKTTLTLTIDDQKLNQKLDSFAAKVESVTNAEFDDHDARVAIYAQFYTNTRRLTEIPTGQKLNRQVLGASTTSNTGKSIYITIDDGPNIVYHPMLLDILKDKGVKATFYFVGSNSKLYTSTTNRTIHEGHAIGDHSLTHAFLPKLLPNQIFDEIKSTKDILNSFLGDRKITLFRPPYGGTNPVVAKYAADLGMRSEFWTVDPRDWSDPSTDELVNRVVNNAQDGSVVLLHSNHFSTVKALPTIIDKLKQKGFEFKVQQ